MSRLKKFMQSLVSGYFTAAAQSIYTLVWIPLALHYLSTTEFGLAAVASDVAFYIALIDAGMNGSISRLLIDHKDNPAGDDYGSIIKTGAVVGCVQGFLIMVVGGAIAFSTASLLGVPAGLQRAFAWLMCGQTTALGLTFMTRIFAQILMAHQRYDIVNKSQTAIYLLSIVGSWMAFELGLGVFSLMAIHIVSFVVLSATTFTAVVRLRLLPERGKWGRVSGKHFNELFKYAGALFVYSLGLQFVNASQTILLTRFVSLEAAGVWVAATRIYKLVAQLIWRSQEYSSAPLAEMFVRSEHIRLRDRIRDTTYLTTNLALFGALGIAVCNHTFVFLWTRGKIDWHPVNDLLLGIWLVITTAMRAHANLASVTKKFGLLAYVCFFEGFLFLLANILLRDIDGITRMLIISILCTLLCTLLYTVRRTRQFLSLTWSDIARWHSTTARVAWRLAVLGAFVWFVTRNWQPVPKLAASVVLSFVAGGALILRFGIAPELRNDIAGRLPRPLRRVAIILGGMQLHQSS